MKRVIRSLDWVTLRIAWRNGVFLLLFFSILAQFLTACEATAPPNGTFSSPSNSSDSNVRIEPDLSRSGGGLSIDPLFPPDGDTRPVQPGQTGRTRAPDGLPLLQPKGLRADDLFREPIKDTNQRLNRLENAVIEMRRDLDAALPAINRLVAIEGDIQELIKQLQSLTSDNSMGSATIPPPGFPLSAPMIDQIDPAGQGIEPLSAEELEVPKIPGSLPPPQKTDPPPQIFDAENPVGTVTELPSSGVTLPPSTTQAQTPSSGISLRVPKPLVKPKPATSISSQKEIRQPISGLLNTDAVRVGDHKDRVRIVLDSATPVALNTDLDASENILVLEIKGVKATAGTKTVKDSKVVGSFTLSPVAEGNTRAVFELKAPTKILRSTTMPPTPENPNYRVVVDLAPQATVTKNATK